MPRKPKAVSKTKIPEIADSLKAKAATPITVTIEELVRSLAIPIQSMLDAGYSYEDVAAVFASHGVELAASSIKSYHKKSQTTLPKSSPSDSTPPASAQLELDEPELKIPEIEESDSPQPKVSAASKFNVTDRRKI